MNVLDALARLVEREQRGRAEDRSGDILERAIYTVKSGGGNTGKLTNTGGAPFSAFAAAGLPVIVENPNARVPFQIDKLKPDVYTVELSIQNPPASSPTDPPIILGTEADVHFSVDGKFAVRRVSVNQGIRLCGQADALTIAVKDVSAFITGRQPNAVEYQVVIGVSRGVRPDLSQPPTLNPIDPTTGLVFLPSALTLIAGAFVLIPVPPGVGVISTNTTIWESPTGGAIVEGQVSVRYRANGTVLRIFDPRVAPWVPIVAGTNEVFIKNDAASTVQVSTLFGIDG
jgi:hypothetical protein